MKITDIPWELLTIGTKVLSPFTGNTGEIKEISSPPFTMNCLFHDEYHSPIVTIEWQGGHKSMHPYCDYHDIEVI